MRVIFYFNDERKETDFISEMLVLLGIKLGI